METKLYVGNLSYTTTEDDLRTLFSQAGTVASVFLVKDRDSGRSKGFAFVEMSNQTEAEQAIRMFNGKPFGDRDLKIDKARPREERPSYGDRGGYGSRGSGYGDRNRRSGGKGGSRRY
jgi:RNA recognition motif-containing protein